MFLNRIENKTIRSLYKAAANTQLEKEDETDLEEQEFIEKDEHDHLQELFVISGRAFNCNHLIVIYENNVNGLRITTAFNLDLCRFGHRSCFLFQPKGTEKVK